jgi:hypothetical protein
MTRVLAMRVADLKERAKGTDCSRTCAECGKRVGLAPSSVRALKDHPGSTIVCSRCVVIDEHDQPLLAPGAAEEIAAYRKRWSH